MLAALASEIKSSDRDVLLSSEELATRDIRKFVDAVLSRIDGGLWRVVILLACREHFARAESWYKMRVRVATNGEQLHLPDRFLEDRAAELCYAPLIKALKGENFKVRAFNYHPSDTWPQRFVQEIGFPGNLVPKEMGSRQVGPGRAALIALIALNRVIPRKAERRKYLKDIRKLPETGTNAGMIFGCGAATAAEQLFAEDRGFLREEYGITIEPVDISAPENGLFIDQAELLEIRKLAEKWGDRGEEIMQIAEQFIRRGA
jgi:hypothetical protein